MKQAESIAARRRIGPLAAFSGATAHTGEDLGDTGAPTVSVNGSTWTTPQGSFGEIGDGYYYYVAPLTEIRERGSLTIRVAGTCDEFVLREDIEPAPQGIPLAATGSADLHIGPLYAGIDGSPVTGEDFSGAGEIEVSINGAAWTAATGRVVALGVGYYDYIPSTAEVATVGWLAVKISGVCDEFVVRAAVVDRPGVVVGTTTIEAIRDQALSLVEAIIPATLSANRFLRHRAERDGRLEDWAEKNPTACMRRVSARLTGTDDPPLVSNTTTETVRSVIELRVAYPQTHRYGTDAARDRDDVIEQDWKKINYAVGLYGRGNFSGDNDCTPLGGSKEVERGTGVDYLVVRLTYEFQRSTT